MMLMKVSGVLFFFLFHHSSTLEEEEAKEECACAENKYSSALNEPTKEEMYKRGHMKEFGAHRPAMKTEVLNYMISPEDFYMHFVVKHKPVVIKGVTKSWPAFKLWTDEYLEKVHGESMMNMETKDDDKYNLPESRKFKEFLRAYKNDSVNLYMVDEVTPKMREEVRLPLCLQCEEIDRFFFVSFYWHSNGGTMSTVHIDTDENLLCVISGHKKVIQVSPVYSHDLYADDTRQMGVLDLNSSAVDLDKYPRVMNVRHYEANVEAGDCIYIPQMWWHQVHSRSERQQAIAMWWKSKPFWKRVSDGEEKAAPLIPEGERRKHSYADSLIDYEYWVQNVTSTLPPITCKEQHVKMSQYSWETDKETENDGERGQTLGEGGDIEEEVFGNVDFSSKDKTVGDVMKKIQETKQSRGQTSCDFDRTNKKSPCYVKGRGDEDNHRFLRYVMDYCQHYDDRGCVINKPQLLNKLMNDEFKSMAFKMKSKFKLPKH